MSSDFGFKASDTPGYFFVSYNTEDSLRVAEICNYLVEGGMHIWYDEGIPHDSYWESVLAEKIDKCEEAIFFITKGIFEKGKTRVLDEIYTYKEYSFARIYGKKVLIVLLDEIDAKNDIPYSLMPWWQQINSRQGIAAFQKSSEEVAYKIIESLNITADNKVSLNSFDNNLNSDNSNRIGDQDKQTVDHKEKWGPERETFTMNAPSTFPTFNSIVDNPTIGDERKFIRIGEIQPKNTQLKENAIVSPGKRYLVYIYFHNNASSIYNDKEHNHVGVALKTRLSTSYPKLVSSERPGYVSATIIAKNAIPNSVWARACLTANEDVQLHYVEGSAKIYCDWKANRSVISDKVFTEEGVLIGLNEMNGVVPGCEEYHGVVTYILQAE